MAPKRIQSGDAHRLHVQSFPPRHVHLCASVAPHIGGSSDASDDEFAASEVERSFTPTTHATDDGQRLFVRLQDNILNSRKDKKKIVG
jgi:hypothetical protein